MGSGGVGREESALDAKLLFSRSATELGVEAAVGSGLTVAMVVVGLRVESGEVVAGEAEVRASRLPRTSLRSRSILASREVGGGEGRGPLVMGALKYACPG